MEIVEVSAAKVKAFMGVEYWVEGRKRRGAF
jgi:hypothetical protein